jgi:hypothetical protein
VLLLPASTCGRCVDDVVTNQIDFPKTPHSAPLRGFLFPPRRHAPLHSQGDASMAQAAPLVVLYEHPDWFRPLFHELDRRGTSYVRLHADEQTFDPQTQPRARTSSLTSAHCSELRKGRQAESLSLQGSPRELTLILWRGDLSGRPL